jgi:tryptophanyl-tRNA synthetase
MPDALRTDGAPTVVQDRLGPLTRRFSHHDQAATVLGSLVPDLHVVTGFGPTNAPTAGTLSVMLGIVELQRRLDVPMTVVISELGAWNSRNVPWQRLTAVRDQMMGFLLGLGFDDRRGALRSHLDHGNLVRAGKIARFLGRQDFLNHRESLLTLYEDEGLLGSEVGLVVDGLYTVADVLEPVETGSRHVLMVSGLEEAYFTELARLVLQRQETAGDLGLGWTANIGALYFRVLEGLRGYPKMSKSIPASSIHLGMSSEQLASRILSDDPADQQPLLSAMKLASGWDSDQLAETRAAYAERATTSVGWRQAKERYLHTFLAFAEQWTRAAG